MTMADVFLLRAQSKRNSSTRGGERTITDSYLEQYDRRSYTYFTFYSIFGTIKATNYRESSMALWPLSMSASRVYRPGWYQCTGCNAPHSLTFILPSTIMKLVAEMRCFFSRNSQIYRKFCSWNETSIKLIILYKSNIGKL